MNGKRKDQFFVMAFETPNLIPIGNLLSKLKISIMKRNLKTYQSSTKKNGVKFLIKLDKTTWITKHLSKIIEQKEFPVDY